MSSYRSTTAPRRRDYPGDETTQGFRFGRHLANMLGNCPRPHTSTCLLLATQLRCTAVLGTNYLARHQREKVYSRRK